MTDADQIVAALLTCGLVSIKSECDPVAAVNTYKQVIEELRKEGLVSRTTRRDA